MTNKGDIRMSEEIKCKFYSDNVCRKKYKRDCLTCINNEYDSLYRLNYENQVKAEENYKRLEQKYNEVLKLAKENADSNEYCIQELEKELEPFKDEYFNGLSNEQIAELAKKSIRLTTYNRELEKEKDKYYQMTLDDEIQINDLMQDNENLARTLDAKNGTIALLKKQNGGLKKTYEKEHDDYLVYKSNNMVLSQALEEIRYDLGNGFNNARRTEDLNALIGIAIDKINKVLEGEVENEQL